MRRARPATFMRHGMPPIRTGLLYNTAKARVFPREPSLREPTLHGVVFEKIYRPAFAATATTWETIEDSPGEAAAVRSTAYFGKTNPIHSAIF